MSNLTESQRRFTQDIGKLINFAYQQDLELTVGEAYRTRPQELLYYTGRTLQSIGGKLRIIKDRRRSSTMKSLHLKRLAMDFNLFKNGELTWDIEDYRQLGRYWESLDSKNTWGGSWETFRDAPHFQRDE